MHFGLENPTRACLTRVLMATVLALGLACSRETAVDSGPAGPRPVAVEVAAVSAETVRDVAEFVGQLTAGASVVIQPEISGLIESIEFDEGQAVKARDVLFRLRSAEQRARLREAESELALQKAIHERTVRLVKGNVSSAAQLDRAAAEHERAKARVQLVRVQLDRTGSTSWIGCS